MIVQTPLFKPQTEWVPPQKFPNLKESKMITVDIETCDEELKVKGPGWPTGNGFITGVAVRSEDFVGYYPVAHQGGGNLDKKKVFSWLKDILALPCPKLFHNATYDVGYFTKGRCKRLEYRSKKRNVEITFCLCG